MATFKVGQRVRIVAARHASNQAYVGCAATIIRTNVTAFSIHDDEMLTDHYDVDIDGVGRIGKHGCQLSAAEWQLAPLTDPKAEQFIEGLKKLANEPVLA